MTMAKAQITPETAGATPITVLFNPNRYSFDASNQLVEVNVPGVATPGLQFVRGGARLLTMQLLFDTYESASDVRDHTDAMYGLLEVDPGTHAPPICRFRWGRVSFRCVVERVNGQFTLFLADGTPVRATLDVTFRQFPKSEEAARWRPTQSADHVTTHTVVRGETLSAIAAQEYGDPGQWRPIAAANRISNPRLVAPGQVLVVPALR